jgi:hypothetical protein
MLERYEIDFAEKVFAEQTSQPSRSWWLRRWRTRHRLVFVHDDATQFQNHCYRVPLIAFPLDLFPKPAGPNGASHRKDHQRPEAELKPAAFAFRRVGFGRLGFHRRILPDRGQPEQEILTAGRG